MHWIPLFKRTKIDLKIIKIGQGEICFWGQALTCANCQGRPHHHVGSWSPMDMSLDPPMTSINKRDLQPHLAPHQLNFFFSLLIWLVRTAYWAYLFLIRVAAKKDVFQIYCRVWPVLTKRYLTKFVCDFCGNLSVWAGHIVWHTTRGFLGMLTRLTAGLTTCLNCRLWPSLTIVFMTVLGWLWPPKKVKFDWIWPSCIMDSLLLLWPALIFWLGLLTAAGKFQIWQFDHHLASQFWLYCTLSLCWTFDIIIIRIDQRVFPVLGFFPNIHQIWCSLVLGCLWHFIVHVLSTVTLNVIYG